MDSTTKFQSYVQAQGALTSKIQNKTSLPRSDPFHILNTLFSSYLTSMATCPAGYICDDTSSNLQYSCEELKVYVEEKGFGPILDGIYCPEGKSKIQNCPAGYFCENVTDDAQECPEEYFCPMKVRRSHLCWRTYDISLNHSFNVHGT